MVNGLPGDRERPHHLQAQRGRDEPRRGDLLDRLDVLEAEPRRDGPGQGLVEHPHHHGDRAGRPPVVEHVAYGDAGLDVDHVVAGQDGDRCRIAEPGVLERRRSRWRRRRSPAGPAPPPRDRNRLRSSRSMTTTCLPCAQQPGGDLQAESAEPHDDHVAGHAPRSPLAQRVVEPAADQEVGDVGHQDREDADARQHEHDGPQPQPPGLSRKAEVAVADRGDGLDAEVERRRAGSCRGLRYCHQSSSVDAEISSTSRVSAR